MMTQKSSSPSGTANPSLSPSQKQEASDSTASISPSSAQHGNALTEGGESASAKTLTTSDGPSRSLPDSPTKCTAPQAESGLKSQEASVSNECQKQSSGNSTMPHSTCCANSSCPKQTEDAKRSSTNSQDSDGVTLSASNCKELARLYSSALSLIWSKDSTLTRRGLEEILSITEYHLEKHKNESTTYENQLRLARAFRKRVLKSKID